MVTTTEDDDLPMRDVYGTDLARVRAMLDRGFTAQLIAGCLAIDLERAHYAILVATGDRQGAPTPEEMAEECRRIQDGWTADQAAAAWRGDARTSSSLVRPNAEQIAAAAREKIAAHWAERRRHRVLHGPIPVTHHPLYTRGKQWSAHVTLGSESARRWHSTREEAEAWGREWLLGAYERQQAGACCGR